MTAKEQGLPEGLEADIDTMRDVYLSPSQRVAYARILAAALASDTGERGVDWLPDAVDRHQLLAGDCPKQAMVVLASSLRRLIAKHDAATRKESDR